MATPKRVAVISECGDCPNFDDDNDSWTFSECRKLKRIVSRFHEIPLDCPLEKFKEEDTGEETKSNP